MSQKVTKITAKRPQKGASAKEGKNLATTAEKTKTPKKTLKNAQKLKTEKPLKEVFILARPFVALGRYLRDSWRELRQVRWPNRKATWKMTFAVLIYCALFIAFIMLLDSLFAFIFNLLLNK